jgi:hypothetical protein
MDPCVERLYGRIFGACERGQTGKHLLAAASDHRFVTPKR